jgi:hypothetical protein
MNNNNAYPNTPFPTPQVQQPMKEIMTVDIVNNDALFYSYYVPPGVTTVLINFSTGNMCIKSTDFNAVPKNPLFYEINQKVQQPPQYQSPSQDNSAVSGLQAQIDEIKQMIVGLANQQQPRNNNNNQKKGGNNQ